MTPEQRHTIKRMDLALCRVSVLADIAETKAARALSIPPKPAKGVPGFVAAAVALKLHLIGSRA